MNYISKRFQSLIELSVPTQLRNSKKEGKAKILILVATFIVTINLLSGSVALVSIENPSLALVKYTTAFFIGVIGLGIFHYTANMKVTSGITSLMLIISVVMSSLETGGIFSPSIYWLAVFTPTVYLFSGLRYSMVGLVLSLLSLLFLFVETQYDLGLVTSYDNQMFVVLVEVFGLVLYTIFFVVVSEERTEFNSSLVKSNVKLKEEMKKNNNLMSVVAHDLRSPLTKIEGLVNLIELTSDPDTEQAKIISMMKNVSNQGKTFIKDLLTANDYNTELEYREVPLRDFIQAEISNFDQASADKDINIVLSNNGNPMVWISPNHLSRILDNLISNALKYSYSKTTITIDYGLINTRLFLSIKDQGQGISDEDQKKMFNMYTKLSARPTNGESSNGLGLWIVKNFIDIMNGEISVFSKINKGTEYIIHLPASKETIPNLKNQASSNNEVMAYEELPIAS